MNVKKVVNCNSKNNLDLLLPHHLELLSVLYNELYERHFALLFCSLHRKLNLILGHTGMVWRIETILASGPVEDFTAPSQMIYWGQDRFSGGDVTRERLLPHKGNVAVNIPAYIFTSEAI